MTVRSKQLEDDCTTKEGGDALELVIESRPRDLGGFTVRRTLPHVRRRLVGPWIFFDHMGPSEFPAGPGIEVLPHPHINIATVTYLFEGEIFHRDSLGSAQAIVPGDLNLMIAGRGIVHSERERPDVTKRKRRLHGLQLWLVLPEADEECEPAFHHYPGASLPTVDVGGAKLRVMIGEAYGVRSPVKRFAHTLYVEADLKKNLSLCLPLAAERAVYVAQGSLFAEGHELQTGSLAVFNDSTEVTVTAQEDTRLVIIGGEKMQPRFIEWNFVSSRKERLEQAKADWSARRFPLVVGDESEFVPYPPK